MERLRQLLRRSHAIKLATSLAMLVLCMLFLADLFSLRGNPFAERQMSRKVVAESLAVQLSTMIGLADDRAVQHALMEFVRRSDDVLAASLTQSSGEVLAEYGNGSLLRPDDRRSSATHMVVPIFDGESTWGHVRVAYEHISRLADDARYFGFLVVGAFLMFIVFLRRALLQIDPSQAVPGRVNSAFNLFTEGVVILDSNLRIMLGNQSAARMTGQAPEQLIGKLLDDWPWMKDEAWQSPWKTAFNTGLGVSDQNLYLDGHDGQRLIVVSCTLVGDEDPSRSGVMVTLNDMSAMQKKNRELSVTLHQLKKTQEHISEKNRELEALAWLDPLTGLLNRRKLMDSFKELVDHALENGQPLVCVMLDIDFFKAINDNYGHAAGDEVICAVAGQLKLVGEAKDIAGRYGGEEFVLVLPDTTLERGTEMAEALREAVEQLANDVTVPVPRITASLGLSELTREDRSQDSVNAMLERADKALYAAKESGRNRVVVHEPDTLTMLAANKAAHDERQKRDASALQDNGQETATPAERISRAAESDSTEPEAADGSDETRLARDADAVQAIVHRHKKEVAMLKSHDHTTRLPRRQLFMHAVENELLRAERMDRSLAIVSIEVRDLQRLLSSLGHQQCEVMIKTVLDRVQDELRASDVVTRINEAHSISHLADNEYGVLLSDLKEPDQALPIITRIRRVLKDPVECEGETIYPGFNIGVALYPDCGDLANELLESAIGARLEAARLPEKVAYHFASADMEKMSREYLQLEADLYQAVAEHQFEVHFQPKFDLATRTIGSVEALVRWTHPTRGNVSPADFIPIAETNGLIGQIFHQVLDAALAQLLEWDRMGLDKISVSVNLSASQLRDADLVSDVLKSLKRADLAPPRLEIELTETSIIQSPQRARIALGQLHDAGVSISMDDFGTGYTSLGLLAELPLDSVKIDRSFIVAMQSSERSRAIVESVINMAHTLRLLVVAEGVETNEQLTTLDALGCNEVQGYLISRPLAGPEITRLLEREGRQQSQRLQAG
ncbi:EAL domain-containing protein [Granulosicoccus sp. 3-233]|uniref:EAL domain-containing protein n=1 Tax=Granulosicoccus sp. 3-233 TaxID=3417969 RepID=UPI003D32A056